VAGRRSADPGGQHRGSRCSSPRARPVHYRDRTAGHGGVPGSGRHPLGLPHARNRTADEGPRGLVQAVGVRSRVGPGDSQSSAKTSARLRPHPNRRRSPGDGAHRRSALRRRPRPARPCRRCQGGVGRERRRPTLGSDNRITRLALRSCTPSSPMGITRKKPGGRGRLGGCPCALRSTWLPRWPSAQDSLYTVRRVGASCSGKGHACE